jgi:hypothetical protein
MRVASSAKIHLARSPSKQAAALSRNARRYFIRDCTYNAATAHRTIARIISYGLFHSRFIRTRAGRVKLIARIVGAELAIA